MSTLIFKKGFRKKAEPVMEELIKDFIYEGDLDVWKDKEGYHWDEDLDENWVRATIANALKYGGIPETAYTFKH